MKIKLTRIFSIILLVLSINRAEAKVVRVEVEERVVIANGHIYGDAGQYEKIRGIIYYEVDPENQANAAIVDLEFAPRNARGMVEFSGDFMLIKPLDMNKANSRLLYEVNNRGRIFSFPSLNGGRLGNNPETLEQFGDGYFMQQGYTFLFSGWNWDVTEGEDRFQFEVPHAMEGTQTIRQIIAAEIINNKHLETLKAIPLSSGSSRGYPSANYPNNLKDVLTVRDSPDGQRITIPNDQWSYSSVKDGEIVPDDRSLFIKGGIQPGKIYELLYEVENPKVVGLGLVGVRDILSFFKFEHQDANGFLNPLVTCNGMQKKLAIHSTYVYGYSQPARFITHMLMQGFHIDEKERMVFDGARIHVAGGGKGGFNSRFAQTTSYPMHLEGHYMPADYPPFNFLAEYDPASGGNNDVLAVAKKMGKMPKIIITNNAAEYWDRSASMIHTTLDGSKDASIHENVRIFLTNGAPHGPAQRRHVDVAEHAVSTINADYVVRATLIMLDEWVSKDIQPADSRYPRLDRGELITAVEHKQQMPKIPGMRHPGTNLQPVICDYGADFWSKGIMTNVPPIITGHYPTFVPATDKDGNGLGGIRLPDITVPLGTYQGFNPRKQHANAHDYLVGHVGSFWPFATTKEERIKNGDPRLSLEERYGEKIENYVEQVIMEVNKLLTDRLLTQADADKIIASAKTISWPPKMLEISPFWEQQNKKKD